MGYSSTQQDLFFANTDEVLEYCKLHQGEIKHPIFL